MVALHQLLSRNEELDKTAVPHLIFISAFIRIQIQQMSGMSSLELGSSKPSDSHLGGFNQRIEQCNDVNKCKSWNILD
jgi:hypothetical protein